MRWRQFHLSTAIVVMLVAGFLLWLNLRPSGCWTSAYLAAKQIRPLSEPVGGDGAGGAANAASSGSSQPEMEFVDFRIGGVYADRCGWPWTAWYFALDVLPMVVVQPVEIPDAWRQQALKECALDLTFSLPDDLFDRVLPGMRSRAVDFRTEETIMFWVDQGGEAQWSMGAIAGNVFVALVILLAVGIGSEWMLRRRT